MCKMTWKLVHYDEQALLSVWQGWHWDDTEGGWLDLELCAKARREEQYTRHQKMYTRESPERTCLRETEKVPIKTEWVERTIDEHSQVVTSRSGEHL